MCGKGAPSRLDDASDAGFEGKSRTKMNSCFLSEHLGALRHLLRWEYRWRWRDLEFSLTHAKWERPVRIQEDWSASGSSEERLALGT